GLVEAAREERRRRRLRALRRSVRMRVDDDLSRRVHDPDAGARRASRCGEDAREAPIFERQPLLDRGLERRAHERALSAPVALEPSEELPLVDAGDLEPRHRDEEHDQVDYEQADANATELPPHQRSTAL